MVGVSLTDFGALKLAYQPLIIKALSSGAKAYNIPEVKNWVGDVMDFRVQTDRNPNMGFLEDAGAYGTPGKQNYVRATVGRRFFAMKLQLSLGVQYASKGEGAFIDAVESEVKGGLKDAISYMNRMFFRDGTGTVGLLKGTPASLTANIQVDNAGLIWKNGIIEIRDTSSSDAVLSTLKVAGLEQAIDSDGYAQFSIDTSYGDGAVSASAVAGDKVVWAGSYNRAISGLDALVDDAATTFQTVNTSTYPEYTSYVDSNSGTARPLTPLILRRTLAAVAQKAGNDGMVKPLKLFANAWVGAEFEAMYEGAYRLQASDKSVGYKGASFMSALGQVDVEQDTDCPRHQAFLLDPSQLVHCVQKPLGFHKDGSEMFRASHDSAVSTAVMTQISQMMIKERKTSAKIEDIDDSATISY